MKRASLFGTVAAAGLFAVSASAGAAPWTLNAGDIAVGVNSDSIAITPTLDVDVSVPSGQTIQGKGTPANTATRGTSGGVNGEIDVSPDYFDFTFSKDVFLSKMDVAWLFPDGEYGDDGNEIGVFETYDASGNLLEDFYLEAQSKTSATLFEDSALTSAVATATVSNLELAQDGSGSDTASGGRWLISDASSADGIFGAFRSLRLVGGDKSGISGSRDSDFSFVSLEGAAAVVPLPPALPLLATGLVALGLFRRRFRQA